MVPPTPSALASATCCRRRSNTVSFTSSGSTGVSGNTASAAGNIDDTVTLPAGATLTYLVTATVSGSASGTLQNTATVTPAAGVTSIRYPAIIRPPTSIPSHRNSICRSPRRTGRARSWPVRSTTYTIQVDNSGPSDVSDAIVADTFSERVLERNVYECREWRSDGKHDQRCGQHQ